MNQTQRLLAPEDFSVETCVTHHYQQGKRWFWHCMTDDTGSGRRAAHQRGHATEQDAATGARYHRDAKIRNRQYAAYLAWWYEQLMTTGDLEFFVALWRQRHGDIGGHLAPEQLMAAVQSDEHLHHVTRRIRGIDHESGPGSGGPATSQNGARQ